MAASRATSLRALKQLSGRATQVRKLHMTGPATFPSPIITSERSAFNSARDAAGLKAEREKARSNQPERHFNTSRELKAVNDSSTMDFAFLPEFDADAEAAQAIRVPLLFSNRAASLAEVEVSKQSEVMPRTIVSVTDDASHISSPSSIIESGTLISSIFGSSSSSNVSSSSHSGSSSKSPDGEIGMAKQIWTDMVDDLFRSGQRKAQA